MQSQGLYKKKEGQSHRKYDDRSRDQRIREIQGCYIAGLEDGEGDHKSRTAGGLQKLENSDKQILSYSFQKEPAWLAT